MADGHLGKCKECTRRDANKHRSKNLSKIRRYDRERASQPHRKKRAAEYSRAYKKRFPLKNAVRTILNNAVRGKKVQKPKRCTVCNRKTRIYGHHDDYYKPLDVIWLCQVCHKGLHKRMEHGTQIQIH